MPLSLKTKFTLLTTLLVLAVVALVSALYVATLTRQRIAETQERARILAQQVFVQAQQALNEAAERGEAPLSDSAEDVRNYVRRALANNAGLTSLIEAAVGYNPTIYEVTITDRDGVALVSSDAALPGRTVAARPPLDALAGENPVAQLRELYRTQNVYEVRLPFNLGREPFGEIRVGLSTVFLRGDITRSLRMPLLLALAAVLASSLIAALTSSLALRPLAAITAQLDRLASEAAALPLRSAAPEPPSRETTADEFGRVQSRITRLGEQLRGTQEVFSTLRDNLNQLVSSLDDGVLLFGADGRALLASPAIERFLGVPPVTLLGRRPEEIFSDGHPLRQALPLDGRGLRSLPLTQLAWDRDDVRRVAARVEVFGDSRDASPAGAMLTLRDLGSIERIGSQIEVSERLAALGRVTAGVAHEVKNPLNSMRLWIENLKESLAAEESEPRRAVQILDKEIDRLDRVVRTFLDFTRPVDLNLEETHLAFLAAEVLALAEPHTRRAKVEVEQTDESGLPPVRVDRALIKQALLNLVLNACDAMPEGGKLRISVGRAPEAAGDAVELSVSDTGHGISAEHRSRIFQLYFTTRPGGSGIGLAATFRIVQLHNGSIDFSSEAGRGTTFRIVLPLAPARPAAMRGRAAESAAS